MPVAVEQIETLDDALQAVAEIGPIARKYAQSAEDDRHLNGEVVAAIADAGLWGATTPREVGGSGLAGMAEQFEIIRALAYEDSSAGWALFICAGTPMLLGSRLSPKGRAEVFADGCGPMSGSFAPGGTGTVVDGGLVVNGRWPFASGISYSQWTMANVIVTDADGTPRPGIGPLPEIRAVVVPTPDVTVIDDWHVAGLRGTGSMSFTLDGMKVPEHRTFAFLGTGVIDEPKYRLSPFPLIASGFAAIAVGIAERVIDEISALLPTRVGPPTFQPASLDAVSQASLGRAIASVRGARESSRAVYARYDARIADGDDLRDLPMADRVEVRQQTIWAAETCQAAVNDLFRLAGASSIYEPGTIQRSWRDINVLAQHVFLRPLAHEFAGKVALGVDFAFPLI